MNLERDSPVRLLLVDDDEDSFVLLKSYVGSMSRATYTLEWASTYDAALAEIGRRRHDVYLVDYRLGGRDGLELIKHAVRLGVRAPMILLTGMGGLEIDIQAVRAGAADYLVKGEVGVELLERSIHYCLAQARTVEALRESEQKFRSIAEAANDAIVLTDRRGTIVYWNRRAAAIFGLDEAEALGRPVETLWSEENKEAIRRALRQWLSKERVHGLGKTVELLGRRKDGREFPLELSLATWRGGRGRLYLAIGRDVSDRKKLETAMIHSEKLAAMGRLASVLAHEIRTPLTIIYGDADIITAKVEKIDPSLVPFLRTIKTQVDRCNTLVANLLEFSRRSEAAAAAFDLRAAVQGALSLVEARAAGKALVEKSLCPQPLRVKGHKDQLEHVIINLFNNALDALPAKGAIRVAARPITRDGRPFAQLEITDNGTGIPKELHEKIFEPFFTTKEPGRGTGLGLWLAQEIVTKHEGVIECADAPGQGTTFTITLPAL